MRWLLPALAAAAAGLLPLSSHLAPAAVHDGDDARAAARDELLADLSPAVLAATGATDRGPIPIVATKRFSRDDALERAALEGLGAAGLALVPAPEHVTPEAARYLRARLARDPHAPRIVGRIVEEELATPAGQPPLLLLRERTTRAGDGLWEIALEAELSDPERPRRIERFAAARTVASSAWLAAASPEQARALLDSGAELLPAQRLALDERADGPGISLAVLAGGAGLLALFLLLFAPALRERALAARGRRKRRARAEGRRIIRPSPPSWAPAHSRSPSLSLAEPRRDMRSYVRP